LVRLKLSLRPFKNGHFCHIFQSWSIGPIKIVSETPEKGPFCHIFKSWSMVLIKIDPETSQNVPFLPQNALGGSLAYWLEMQKQRDVKRRRHENRGSRQVTVLLIQTEALTIQYQTPKRQKHCPASAPIRKQKFRESVSAYRKCTWSDGGLKSGRRSLW
jgi:hypothetical protein